MSKVVLLGNPNPMTQVKMPRAGATPEDLSSGEGFQLIPMRSHLKQSVTRVELWDGIDDPEYVELSLKVSPTASDNDRLLAARGARMAKAHRNYAVVMHDLEAILAIHSDGRAPTWVRVVDPDLPRQENGLEADGDQELQAAIASYFGCAQGEPTALVTNGGIDYYFAQIMGTTGAALNFGALTANSTAPSATDTSLTAEITTASGGLIRATMSYAHTAGTTTATLTHTWTANGSDVLPVTIAKWGQFNASSAGTMGSEVLVSPTATLSNVGDSLSLTYTLTL